MIDGMAVEGKQIIIPSQLQVQILRQLHTNYMGIEKTCESIGWVNMNADIENAVKHCLEYHNTQP